MTVRPIFDRSLNCQGIPKGMEYDCTDDWRLETKALGNPRFFKLKKKKKKKKWPDNGIKYLANETLSKPYFLAGTNNPGN